MTFVVFAPLFLNSPTGASNVNKQKQILVFEISEIILDLKIVQEDLIFKVEISIHLLNYLFEKNS